MAMPGGPQAAAGNRQHVTVVQRGKRCSGCILQVSRHTTDVLIMFDNAADSLGTQIQRIDELRRCL